MAECGFFCSRDSRVAELGLGVLRKKKKKKQEKHAKNTFGPPFTHITPNTFRMTSWKTSRLGLMLLAYLNSVAQAHDGEHAGVFGLDWNAILTGANLQYALYTVFGI